MESTSPKKLRAELKDYLYLATNKPIRIQRRSGENYILMNEKIYADLQNVVVSLVCLALARWLMVRPQNTKVKMTDLSGSKNRW